ncbi:MAG TPA: endonuclease/exonuclease/phosphatase family protein [Gaiellaceae bacterium]|nr:endonuclease/exonuclease/phosphatase family protein [Gaiellaceae bacterium]
MLVRSWNLFHGNAVPPERRAYLREMVELAAADAPDVLCLQELPVWALDHLAGWSGMQAVGDVAAPPRIGPLPSSAALGRVVTELNHGLLRSAFTGQANAVLVAPAIRVLSHDHVVLNSKRFRDAQARALRLGVVARLAWARERRVCQGVCLALPDGRRAVVANLHATGLAADRRVAEAELVRAATFAEALAGPDELCVLAGDFNLRAGARVFAELAKWGFAGGGPGIDHVLVRGGAAGPLRVWPDERRRLDGRLVSDHAPVEVTIE